MHHYDHGWGLSPNVRWRLVQNVVKAVRHVLAHVVRSRAGGVERRVVGRVGTQRVTQPLREAAFIRLMFAFVFATQFASSVSAEARLNTDECSCFASLSLPVGFCLDTEPARFALLGSSIIPSDLSLQWI